MIAEFLRGLPLRYDVLTRKIQMNTAQGWTELTERGLGDLFVECNQALGRNIAMTDLRAVLHSGVVPEVNPLREYVLGLAEWDGQTDYIGQAAAMVSVLEGPGECGQAAGGINAERRMQALSGQQALPEAE